MVLAIDMGNSNIVIGCIEEGKILFEERLCTDLSKTELEYAMGFQSVLDIHKINKKQIEGAILSSVVPPLTNVILHSVYKITGLTAMAVGPGIKTGLNLLMDDPKGIGADLIVDAVAGIAEYGAPLILIDMGTATTVTVVDKEGNYIGGMIIPGLRVALESLVERTSLLPMVSLEPPEKVIGKNTVDCLKSGLILGSASLLDGQIQRIEKELGYSCKVVATGGLAKIVTPLCSRKMIVDDGLLLKGLYLLYRKNTERK